MFLRRVFYTGTRPFWGALHHIKNAKIVRREAARRTQNINNLTQYNKIFHYQTKVLKFVICHIKELADIKLDIRSTGNGSPLFQV